MPWLIQCSFHEICSVSQCMRERWMDIPCKHWNAGCERVGDRYEACRAMRVSGYGCDYAMCQIQTHVAAEGIGVLDRRQ
jgi:hypothetical protein